MTVWYGYVSSRNNECDAAYLKTEVQAVTSQTLNNVPDLMTVDSNTLDARDQTKWIMLR